MALFIILSFSTFSNATSKNRNNHLKGVDVNSNTINYIGQPKVNAVAKNKQEFTDILVYRIKNLYAGPYSISISKKNFKSYKDFRNFIDALLSELFNNPEVYDVLPSNGYYTIEYSKNYILKVDKPKYFYKKSDLVALKSFINKWTKENINSSMSDEEKVRVIHDYIVHQYVYSYGDKGKNSNSTAENSTRKGYSVYTSFALVFTGGGVCNSNAILFYRMAKQAGLDVKYIVGEIAGKDSHAWNMVKVDGDWYHIDVTYDRIAEEEKYTTEEMFKEYGLKYYLISDENIKWKSKRRSWDYSKFPKARKNYYDNKKEKNFSDN